MLANVTSRAVVELAAAIVEVEAGIERGLPSIIIVGLPDEAIQENREWVRAVICDTSLSFL